MMTGDEETFLAGLLAGIAVAIARTAAGPDERAAWRDFLTHIRDLLTAHADGDPDAANRLYEEIGRYEPARHAFLTALGEAGRGGDRSVAAEPLHSDPDPLSNVLVLYREYTRGDESGTHSQ